MLKTFKCKLCGFSIEANGGAAIIPHYREKHPEYRGERAKHPILATVTSAYNRILDAEKTIRDSLKELEFERDQKMNEIRLLDDKISKYKKLV